MGEGFLPFHFLNAKCAAESRARMHAPRQSSRARAGRLETERKVLRAIVSAVERISATTHGLTPPRNARTPA